MSNRKVSTTVSIPGELLAKLDEWAIDAKRSRSFLIVELLSQALSERKGGSNADKT